MIASSVNGKTTVAVRPLLEEGASTFIRFNKAIEHSITKARNEKQQEHHARARPPHRITDGKAAPKGGLAASLLYRP